MKKKREKSQQEYEKEIAKLVAAGKKLMAEANEIISAQPGMRKQCRAKGQQCKHKEKGRVSRLGLGENICAMTLGYKLGEKMFGSDNPHDDDFEPNHIDDFDQVSIDDYIEEEDDY